MKRLWIVIAALILGLQGCASVPGPTNNSISQSYIDTFDRTWDATIRSVKANGFFIAQLKKGDGRGVILATANNGIEIRLEVEFWTSGTVYVHILPDGLAEAEKVARLVHREIDRQL